MPNGNTPSYITTLLMPRSKAPQGRRVWNMDLETVVVPYLTAMNTTGQAAIAHDSLGAPLRLGYGKDGSVKFKANGRPTIVVAKPIRDAVSLMRENFVAHLQGYTHEVATEHKDEFNHEVALCIEAGKPLIAADKDALDKAVRAQLEKAMADAQNAGAPEEQREAVPA